MPTGTLASQPTVPLHPVRSHPPTMPSRSAPRGGSLWRVGLGLLLVAAGTVVTGYTWVRLVASAPGRRLDESLMATVEERFDALREPFLHALNLVSVGSVGISLAVLVVIALVRRRPGVAVAAVVMSLGSEAVTQIVKGALPREGPMDNSLPSGHVTAVAGLVLAALIVLPPVLRWLAALPGLALIAAASVAVMAVGWHRPGDVIAAYAVVTAVGGALLAVDGVRRW